MISENFYLFLFRYHLSQFKNNPFIHLFVKHEKNSFVLMIWFKNILLDKSLGKCCKIIFIIFTYNVSLPIISNVKINHMSRNNLFGLLEWLEIIFVGNLHAIILIRNGENSCYTIDLITAPQKLSSWIYCINVRKEHR